MASVPRASPAALDISPYVYKPLAEEDAEGKFEINLVNILPSSKGAPLICEITTVHLLNSFDPIVGKREYEALSYVWGTGGLSHEILICGETTTKICITETLYSALQRLRFEDRNRCLWIDQICINLADPLERNRQVRLMGVIYRHAQRVIIDLGEATEHSNVAFDYAATLHDAASLESRFCAEGRLIPDFNVLEDMPIDVIEATMNILLRSWFRRLWVIQEAVLASEIIVYCGTRTVTWSQLVVLALSGSSVLIVHRRKFMYKNEWEDISSVSNMLYGLAVMRRKQDDVQMYRLAAVVMAYRSAEATDPRDKIFGFFGICGDDVCEKIRVDYSKDVHSVYQEFARTALKAGDIFLLNHAGIAQASSLNLPSWVPDWRFAKDEPLFQREFDAGGPVRNMGQSILTSANISTIQVNGALLAKVKVLGNALPRPFTIQDFADFAGKCQEIIKHLDMYSTGEDVFEAYCRTLIANHWDPVGPKSVEKPERFGEIYTTILREPGGRRSEIEKIYLDNLVVEKRFCITDNGYMGLFPQDIREGDWICIVRGAETPLVLREQEETYCLIDYCYVYGLMDGEALELDYFKDEWLTLI
ncbi:hypothetical protein GJ744_012398 [Endocarpon pusillum]|uniref:Heterokaryon incompatibility domain-containing protein n=1 Tax=Endocarpon pusillum TaxID=364733 RepID=A0A8H7AF41_9EURO|nr:hypothetical protein GJ744_012398 [Endocarpon pusillum]